MKADRLLAVLLLLQTRGTVSARELAERLDVSVRTVYRDVEALSAAGVPVYAERGRYGGIALLPGFRTDVTGLTADEARALFVFTADDAHAALGLDTALGSALRKLMAALPAPHRPAAERTSRRVLVDPVRWMSGPRAAVDVAELHDAVLADVRLRLRYRHGGQEVPRDYTVDPYGLVVKAGVWYLVADLDECPRLFRADRIHSAEATDDPVRRRAGVELAEVWEALRAGVEQRPAAVRLRVRVRRDRLELFRRLNAGALTGEPRPDGPRPGEEPGEWLLAELAVAELGRARPLLAFGAAVEVLDPPEARAFLAGAAAEVVALYGDGGVPGPLPRPARGGRGGRGDGGDGPPGRQP
ncbi:helix-turn-helix transcriptional regulator [Streptomyces sp. NPDC017448]|uniref:helix-turn-helix transcriptional regulator n=1 Tax=Streptomyces sp. NPDC017448 TaxID=3364996 RepID=UPI003795B600